VKKVLKINPFLTDYGILPANWSMKGILAIDGRVTAIFRVGQRLFALSNSHQEHRQVKS